jgi:hypothetical protein
MNKAAEKHLDKAVRFLAKGEEFYRNAATEIVAAQAADPTLSNTEIGKHFGKSRDWVRGVVTWATTSEDTRSLYPWSHDTPRRQVAMAKQVLREAPMEQVEQLISELPPERRKDVSIAAIKAGHTPPEPRPYRDPTFIDLIVKVSGTLHEIRSLLAKCEDASGIPPEFSEASMDDIAAKAMQIKEMVKALRSDSNDEWQRIVNELREA